MAGGTWTGQNKVQPGVYINTKSKGTLRHRLRERDRCNCRSPFMGPGGEMQTIIPERVNVLYRL